MSSRPIIRVLSADDLVPMRRVLALFGEVFGEPETCSSKQPDDDYLRGLLGGGAFVCVAAFLGDEVIGGLAGYVLPKFEQRRSEFYIYDLAVAGPHRRRGVATAMIDEVRRIAALRGIYVILVQADYGDEPAIALYTKLGRREEILHFEIWPAETDVGRGIELAP